MSGRSAGQPVPAGPQGPQPHIFEKPASFVQGTHWQSPSGYWQKVAGHGAPVASAVNDEGQLMALVLHPSEGGSTDHME